MYPGRVARTDRLREYRVVGSQRVFGVAVLLLVPLPVEGLGVHLFHLLRYGCDGGGAVIDPVPSGGVPDRFPVLFAAELIECLCSGMACVVDTYC